MTETNGKTHRRVEHVLPAWIHTWSDDSHARDAVALSVLCSPERSPALHTSALSWQIKRWWGQNILLILFAAVSLKLLWSHSYSLCFTISILNEKIFHFGGKWFEMISWSYKSNWLLFIYKAQRHTSRFASRGFQGYRNIGRFHVILLIQLQNNWVSVLKWFSCTHICFFFSSVFHLEWSFGCGAASRAEKRGWQINGWSHDDIWLWLK